MAIIGISSIHLLKTFIEVGTIGGLPLCGTGAAIAAAQALSAAGSVGKGCTQVTAEGVMWQTIIHSVFIFPRSASPGPTASCRSASTRHAKDTDPHA